MIRRVSLVLVALTVALVVPVPPTGATAPPLAARAIASAGPGLGIGVLIAPDEVVAFGSRISGDAAHYPVRVTFHAAARLDSAVSIGGLTPERYAVSGAVRCWTVVATHYRGAASVVALIRLAAPVDPEIAAPVRIGGVHGGALTVIDAGGRATPAFVEGPIRVTGYREPLPGISAHVWGAAFDWRGGFVGFTFPLIGGGGALVSFDPRVCGPLPPRPAARPEPQPLPPLPDRPMLRPVEALALRLPEQPGPLSGPVMAALARRLLACGVAVRADAPVAVTVSAAVQQVLAMDRPGRVERVVATAMVSQPPPPQRVTIQLILPPETGPDEIADALMERGLYALCRVRSVE